MGRPASGKWRAEPRSEPDSGHPTVRDRRGALGDVTHGEPRNPTRKSKERLWSLLAYRCARPGSIPTTRTSGSVGGQGQQRPWSTRPRGGHRHHQPGDLGPPPHGHPRRPLGLARHRARVPRPAARESPPPGLLRAPRIPRCPRPPPRPVAGHPRPRLLLRLAQAGDPRPQLGRDRRGRRRHPALARALEDAGGADSPDLTTHCRGPGAVAGTPRPR